MKKMFSHEQMCDVVGLSPADQYKVLSIAQYGAHERYTVPNVIAIWAASELSKKLHGKGFFICEDLFVDLLCKLTDSFVFRDRHFFETRHIVRRGNELWFSWNEPIGNGAEQLVSLPMFFTKLEESGYIPEGEPLFHGQNNATEL